MRAIFGEDRTCHAVCRLRSLDWLARLNRVLKLPAVVSPLHVSRPPCGASGADGTTRSGARVCTCADLVNTLRSAMAARNLIDPSDEVAFFKIVMFAEYMRSQLSATISGVRRRRRTLEIRFLEFVLVDMARPEEMAEAAVDDAHGDVVVETTAKPEGSGSKRRRRSLSYEEELTRVREVKRRYRLRSTRAREERMASLKKADDAKRKVDSNAGSSSKISRKRSRR